MPQVIPAVIAAGKAFLASKAWWAIAAKFVLKTAVVYGISRALTKRPGIGSIRGQEVNARDPAAPRQIIYGLRRVSGVMYPVGVSGANNDYLHLLLLIAGHECEDLGMIHFNDEEVPLDASGNATGRYAGYVRIKKHRGLHNETVDTDLQTDLGASYWSINHRLQGIAYLYVRLKVSADLFSGGLPEIYCVVKGRKVYDPRDGTQSATDAATWKWSKNAALCLADWILGVPTRNGAGTLVRNFGLGAAIEEVDTTALIAAANICDESVGVATSFTKACDIASGNRHIGVSSTSSIVPGLKVTGTGLPAGTTVTSVDESGTFFTVSHDPTATGNPVTVTFGDTEPRYECNGALSTSVRAGDGIELLKTAMAGDAPYIAGKWTILAGAYRTPTVTIDEGDLRAPLTGVRFKPSRKEIYNVVRGLYVSPANNWQPADIPKVSNATYKTQDGGEDLPADVELHFTTSGSMAQRLNKITMERSRQGIAFVARCKLTAFQNQAGDVVQVTNSRFGWSAKPFEVLAASLVVEDDANGNPYIGVDLTLRETASGVWTWASGEETAIDLAPNTTLPDPFTVAAPTSLSVTNSVQQQNDGTAVPRLAVSWTAPADIHVTSGGQIRVEYKLAASSDYLPVDLIRGDITALYIMAVIIGQSYNVRVRSENNLGVASAWVTSGSVAVTGDTSAPSAPTGLSVTANAGYNTVKWTQSTSDDIFEYQIFRHTANDSTAATLIGENSGDFFNDTTAVAGTPYWYWVASVDGSENVGARTAAGTVTTSSVPPTDLAPTAPTAAFRVTAGADDTYGAGDGTVFAFITMRVAALPANARWQNLLYRRTGATDWLVASQIENAAQTDMRIDDLTPGVSYDVATQAFSAHGRGSTIVVATSSPFTAPTKSGAPATPTGAVLTKDAATIKWSSTSSYFGFHAGWSHNTEKDIAYYEVKATQTDTDGATDYLWFPSNATASLIRTTQNFMDYYRDNPIDVYVRVRAVNTSGVASGWLRVGAANSTVYQLIYGTMYLQDKNAIAVTGGTATGITNLETTGVKVGSGTSVNKMLAKYEDTIVVSLAGGAPTEAWQQSISNRGFSTKPDYGDVNYQNGASASALHCHYDYDDAANSSTIAVIRVRTYDGTNIAAGNHRFAVNFQEKD